ncbi:NAD-dependent epimerase/dehydratase family protein [Hydrogenophaga sp.]|uniref:NAD-dependent epimerase/dehydratase family protein n=1 Tax=Hydrogenophaga sp. TaxID=1904254 RepID=UPI00262208EE|nr:NAD-dependent epimerase/dehydratase family protein [Hydrogenophaga sp.]
MKILVTGAAGFIGQAVCKKLLMDNVSVVGIDNLNDYYSPALKHARLNDLASFEQFEFSALDFSDTSEVQRLFANNTFDGVIHLGAQAGVRYSIENPAVYTASNLVGFANILECCRRHETPHLVYASSSSVYGRNSKVPFSESDPVEHPASYYAATKRSNELMAESYVNLYDMAITGLRFFTVYGPWGRPDMAPWLFTDAILKGVPIKLFNHGNMSRDFTYIDDIVEGVVRIFRKPPEGNKGHALYNIGNSSPVQLLEFITTIERCCEKKAERILLPMQDGDVPATFADTSRLEQAIGFIPGTPLQEGMSKFVEWFRGYHKI